MDFFNNKKLGIQKVTAPEGMFNQVKERLVEERKQIAQTRRQLTVGAALLLVFWAFNMGLFYYKINSPTQNEIAKVETVLNDTYFNNHLSL